jgi:hypothetical protein
VVGRCTPDCCATFPFCIVTPLDTARRSDGTGRVPTSDMNLGGMEAVRLDRIRTVYEQPADAGLIKFKPLPGSDSSSGIVGMSKITGQGSNVVEGQAKPGITIEFSRSGSESRRRRNHEPAKSGIPKRKKIDRRGSLSCKNDYLFRSNHVEQSIASEFFTDD